MKIDLEFLNGLAESLPALQFNPEQDRFAADPAAQAYLDYYGINFSRARPGVQHGFGHLDAAGFRIAVHYWLPPEPVATLVVVHGYYDHVGLYGRAVEFGLQHNYAVLAFDLPGHGLSSGPRVEIESFDQYAAVLDALLDRAEEQLPSPLYAMGQSTGGTILLIYLWRHASERLRRVALLAPLLLPEGWKLGRIAHLLLKNWLSRVPRAFVDSSHDPVFNEFQARRDPLQARHVAVNWVSAMKDWEATFRQASALDKPVLVIQGTGDETVDWRYNLPQITGKLPNARVEMIADARHHLVNESDTYREQVFAALADWFEKNQ
jgi:lysophospholipase